MSSKHRILIVDDEPLNVKLFAAILSSDSYEVTRAYNGEQALKKVNEDCSVKPLVWETSDDR